MNAGITVQILLDHFDLRGIVHYGIAGGADDSLSLGDVSIPRLVAFTGSWTWTVNRILTSSSAIARPLSLRDPHIPPIFFSQRFKSADEEGESKAELALLNIGAFNIPEKGKNLLSSLEFKPEEFFAVGEEMKKVFWLETFPPWFQLARKLQVSLSIHLQVV